METLLEQDLQEVDFIELLAVRHEKLTKGDLMELEAQRKDEERQEEEETEEPKSYLMQEMARGFYLFEEALLVSECARVCAVDSIVPNSLCPYRL